MDMVVKAFSSLMMLAVVIDNKNEEEQKEAISEMAGSRKVELTSLLPHMKSCALVIGREQQSRIAGRQRYRASLTGTQYR